MQMKDARCIWKCELEFIVRGFGDVMNGLDGDDGAMQLQVPSWAFIY